MPNSDETPVQPDQGSSEPTLIVNRSDKTAPPPASSDETVIGKSASVAQPSPASSDEAVIGKSVSAAQPPPASSDETVIGKSASAAQPSPAPSDQSIHNQDTVVSPRLRQLATTPAQPLRPPQGRPPRPAGVRPPTSWASSRLYMLVGIVAVLVLLAVILVGVILARTGPTLLAGVFATKTPTATATRAATPTSVFPPTFTPTRIPPTSPPTPVPPTKTPRPAPVALAKDVVAKVSPPEGLKLKVRKSPSSTGDILGELDKDVQVTILEGPTDANGITWWKVDNGKGLVGWSAEGVGGVKYLLPMGWAN